MGRNALVIGLIVVIALAAIIGVAALRSRPAAEAPPQPGTAGGRPPAPAPANLKPAPDIQIVMYQGEGTVGGGRIALSQLWRKQPVVLNFWAGLCPPCRAEMPDFQRFYAEGGKDRFTLIGVDIGPFIGLGSREDGRALLRELHITFPAGTTFDARTVRNYEILGMPTTVFITSDGKIWRKHTGLLTRGQMDAFTAELLRVSGVR